MRLITETERLIVREWTDSQEDLDRVFDIYSRPEVTKWLGMALPLTDRAQAVAAQERRSAMYTKHGGRYGVWAVQLRDTGLVAGSVLLVPLPEPSDGVPSRGEVEIGWHLHPECWGQGYATESAQAVMEHGFRTGLSEIFAIAKPDNGPSLAVMRRLGMSHIGRTNRWYGLEAELYVRGRLIPGNEL